MTGTDLYKHTHKSVPVIIEPPCTFLMKLDLGWEITTVSHYRGFWIASLEP